MPEMKFCGTWRYGNSKPVEYLVRKVADGRLCFEGPHSTCGTLSGMLVEQSDGWLLAKLFAAGGMEIGEIRLMFCAEDRGQEAHHGFVLKVSPGRVSVSQAS